MYRMAKVMEHAGSRHIKVMCRDGLIYDVQIPDSLATRKHPKITEMIVIERGISIRHANYICPGEGAVYLIKETTATEVPGTSGQRRSKLLRQDGKTRVIKFVDQDILFSTLVRELELTNYEFIWNDRSIAFRDPKRTIINFYVVEIEVIHETLKPTKVSNESSQV